MTDGPIKPEDIVSETLRGQRLSADFIAAVLNAAIESGIVSPPCRVLRSKYGTLYPEVLYPSDDVAQSNASPGDSSEHWKGQTG